MLPPPDGSRDPRIEDPSNRWIVHLIGRALLPLALRLRINANAVSVAGLLFGAAAAYCFHHWQEPGRPLIGLILCLAWLIADGLDGMIARATRTASDLGRFLDGLCDHGVFVLLYVALATSIGTGEAWALALSAGALHAIQASLYEGERMRFHRRLRGDAGVLDKAPSRNPLVRSYDAIASSLDRWARPFDVALSAADDRARLGAAYGTHAAPALAGMWVLSNNMRVLLIFAACLAGNPRLFWWIEIAPMSLIAVIGIVRHRAAERRLLRDLASASHTNASSTERLYQ